MATPFYIPFGTSEPQDFELRNDGEPIPDLTGVEVELQIERKDGDAIDTPPTVAWLDRDAATVRVTGCDALATGSYLVRFKLIGGSGDVGYAPNGKDPDVWSVVDP